MPSPARRLSRIALEARLADGRTHERLTILLLSECFGCQARLTTQREVDAGCLCEPCQHKAEWQRN